MNKKQDTIIHGTLVSKFMPITINMHIDIKSIFDYESDIKLTNSIDYPKCSYGFHHYMHSLKKDTEILKQFENKKKVYLVTNKFEIDIDKYNNTINNEVHKYLNIKDKIPKIISLDFYKLWELLFMFDLVNIDDNFKSAYLNEDGTNIQCLINFREKYAKDTKSDKYYFIKNNSNLKLNNIDNSILSYYNKNITQTNIDSVKDKIDFITAGSAFTYHDDNENTIEQEYHLSLLKNIYDCVIIQKKGGSFVCKLFETYTEVSAKILCILISLYDKVFFIKPLTSKPNTTEKYAVCIGFKVSNTTQIIKKLDKIFDLINKNNKLKVCDIFNSYDIDKKLKIRLIKINQLTSNFIFKSIGEMVNFVNSQDYYGDTYEKYRDLQIEANNFWVETFLPEPKKYKENKKKITEASILTNKINVDDAIELEKKLFI